VFDSIAGGGFDDIKDPKSNLSSKKKHRDLKTSKAPLEITLE
jgi:hypothetical protein